MHLAHRKKESKMARCKAKNSLPLAPGQTPQCKREALPGKSYCAFHKNRGKPSVRPGRVTVHSLGRKRFNRAAFGI